MLLLTATTDKIQLITSANGAVDVVAMFMDHTLSTDNVEGGRQLTAISTAATTDIIASPSSGVTRNIKAIHARNKSAVNIDVTVVFDANGTDYEIHKVTLQPGEMLEYVDGVGFFVARNTAKLDVMLRVVSDVTFATTSWADVTGLTYPVESGKSYVFDACLFHIENASTTGARFGVNGPTNSSIRLGGVGVYTGSLTAAVMQAATADVAAYDTGVGGAPTASTTTPHVTTMRYGGSVVTTAAGTLAIRAQSEVAVAAGVTVKAGSWARFTEV